MQTGNILIPVVSVGITNAVLRFGLDAGSDRRCLFTTGLATVLLGEGVLFLLSPLLQGVGLLSEYTGLILLYVLMANLHGVCSSMAQALDRVRLYAAAASSAPPWWWGATCCCCPCSSWGSWGMSCPTSSPTGWPPSSWSLP